MFTKFHRCVLGLSVAFAVLGAARGAAQSNNPAIRLDSVPTGLAPLGVAIAVPASVGSFLQAYVAVANSGDNSVGVLRLSLDQNTPGPKALAPLASINGIPAPYAVTACGGNLVAVTSPSDNSVRVIQLPDGNILGTARSAAQPYAAVCFREAGTGKTKLAVSYFGDSSLIVFDPDMLAVTATIPGVPGSRAFHGIAVSANSTTSQVAWVAGTDANVVTVVDLLRATVLTRIAVAHPTAIITSGDGPEAGMVVASAANNNVTCYNRDTLQVLPGYEKFVNITNPQDLVSTGSGWFVTMGGQDSVWRYYGEPPSTIPGIPGAAALAFTSFNFKPNFSDTAVLVTSTKSNSVFLIQQQPVLPAQFGIANGASFGSWAAPGSLVSAFLSTGVTQPSYAPSVPLPSTIGGFTISAGGALNSSATSGWTYSGGAPASLLYIGPTQVNLQIPPAVAPGTSVPVQIRKPDGSTLLATVTVAAAAPGIFTVLMNGQGQGAVLNQDNGRNGDPKVLVGVNPAARGSVIQIFATGAGDTTPALAAGEAAPTGGNPLVLTKVQPTVTIGGKNAKVQFSGMAPGFVGLWQINAEVPQDVTPGGAVPLVITAAGAQGNTVTIAVQ